MAKRAQSDTGQKIDLDAATAHLLDECRMVLPGIQTLFGFQLISVFSNGFAERLTRAEQVLHLATIVLVVVAIALVMAPAALHRQSRLDMVQERFLRLGSRLLVASMFPLAVAICVEVYLVARLVLDDRILSAGVATALLLVFAGLWLLLPRVGAIRD